MWRCVVGIWGPVTVNGDLVGTVHEAGEWFSSLWRRLVVSAQLSGSLGTPGCTEWQSTDCDGSWDVQCTPTCRRLGFGVFLSNWGSPLLSHPYGSSMPVVPYLLERQNSACPDTPDRGAGERVQVKMDKLKERNTFRRIGKHLKHQDMFVHSHLVPDTEVFAITTKQLTPSHFHLRGFKRMSPVQTQTKRDLKAVMGTRPRGERQRE